MIPTGLPPSLLPVLSTIFYIGMGWLCVLAYRPLLDSVPPAGLIWLLVGGIVYTVGVLFYALRQLAYSHAVWHLFVIGGSVCHFFAVHTLVNLPA